MILYPAIDIRAGRAVRLTRGDYGRERAYDADPAEAARRWVRDGAGHLHVVDLDGAREGLPRNLEHVRRIVAAADVPVQLGGGLRSDEGVARALAAGVARAVLGTRAQAEPEWVGSLVAQHGEERIVAAVDTRGGRVAVGGWLEDTGTEPAALIAALAAEGVRRFVYTPVEVDGTLDGPGIEPLRAAAAAAAAAGAELVYSGGIGTLAHLRALASLELEALTGVIVGKALYEGRFTVAEGQAALGA